MSEVLLVAAGVLAGLALGVALFGRAPAPRREPVLSGSDHALAEQQRVARLQSEVLERVAQSVVLLNDALTPVLANRAARDLLGLRDPLPPSLPSDEISSLARRALTGTDGATAVIDLWSPSKRTVRVEAVSLPQAAGVVVLVDDVSAERRVHRLRRQFVAHASHELKTPVAGIQALAEAIEGAVGDDAETAAQFAQRLVGEAERLGRLITDLLDLSRLEDPASISSGRVHLSEVVEREVRASKDHADAKRIDLKSELAPGVFVRGDEQQLGLMIRNLVDNAIRYSGAGDEVAVALSSNGDAVIEVRDNGIGIPFKHQSRVFERFYRVDEARARDTGGTGLGLAIVKHVADVHGGRVELSSELGEGSTFVVHLPQAEAAEDG